MPNNPPPPARSPSARSCPLCGKPGVQQYRPFCSRGCRDRDLNAWFAEDYRAPVRGGADEGDDPDQPPQ